MHFTQVLEKLKAGNQNYIKGKSASNNRDAAKRKEVINGQNPFAIILSCADSRVVPELIFDTGIGELFVVRVAGNIANSSSIASIEYAVSHLSTPLIVVLGHENCGAINAAMQGGNPGNNLKHLLSHLRPSIIESGENATPDQVAMKNAMLTVEHLISRSSIISKALDAGELEIIPGFYHLSTGEVEFLLSSLNHPES